MAALISLVSMVGYGRAEDTAGRRLEQLREQIDLLEQDLGGLEQRSEKEQKALRTVEIEIGRLSRRLRLLKGKLRKQHNRLQQLEMQRRQYESAVEKQRRSLERQLRTAYMIGRQAYLKMVLNQQEPWKLGRVLIYYDYFNRARAERIHRLREQLTHLRRLATEAREERSTIARLTEQREREKRALDRSKRKREEVLAALRQKIGEGRARLERLRKDEADLKALLLRLKRQAKQSSGPSPFGEGNRGRFLWPVDGPIKAAFGSPRTRELRWKGVLIDAPEGAPVKAISAGRVVFADWLRGYGLLVIVDHGSGYMSLYGHNQSIRKEEGSQVEAGEVISTVGNSGGNVHSGLYFEIRRDGQPVDPAQWCVARE